MGETTIILISLIIFNIVFVIFISAVVIFIREYRIKKKGHMAEIKGIDEVHKKHLLETEFEIQSQTMKHIGREIHDNIGQKLTLASLYTQQLSFENKTPQINSKIETISEIINESLTELRQLSKTLTDNTIKSSSITDLIQNECKKINDLKQCTVTFKSALDISIDSYQIKSILLRISQEFMQNSIKHSQCKNIDVLLTKNRDDIILILKDNGKGFTIEHSKDKGIGLKNIQKRTELIGGIYTLESKPTEGTQLTIQIKN